MESTAKISEAPLQLQMPVLENIETIKLYKNETSKGIISYAWDIRIIGIDIDKIEKLNNEMLKRFPSPSNYMGE